IFGNGGSKLRGLEELQNVADQGFYASEDAQVALSVFYALERRYDKSLNLLDMLSAKYPRNYLFKLERANMLNKLNRPEESSRIYEELLKDESMNKIADMVHFQYGEALASQQRSAVAIEHFRTVISLPDANPGLVTRSHLRAGQLLDLMQ